MTLRDAREALARFSRDSRGRSIEWIVAAAEWEDDPPETLHLPDDELIPLLVELAGADLLSDRELRRIVADACDVGRLKQLHSYESGIRGAQSHRSQVDAVARRKWIPGKSWAAYFVRTLRLPSAYAGSKSEAALPDTVDVEPCVKLPPLRDFQEELCEQVIKVVSRRLASNRAILTLPTGAGKTRTTAEALLAWRQEESEPPLVLWIAQSEELCEQAVQSFREVWFDLGHRSTSFRKTLTIGRLWGERNAVPLECGVVVASIQKLHAAARDEGREMSSKDLEIIGERTGVVVIDEAHRALAPSYGAVLDRLGINPRSKQSHAALIGLTATPRRANEDETTRLRRRFHNRILNAPSLGQDPVQTLRGQGILALMRYESLDYEARRTELSATARYKKYYETFEDLHPDVLTRLGEEHRRNRRILERLLELDPGWPVLLFACSTQHAQAMASLLQRHGRTAACVLGTTRPATRRALIERFRDGNLSVLCNYGVLTTGFDAPRVRCVVVARPTASRILYEQMVGRGMRGPEFGGTEQCLVIDVDDNIQWRHAPVAIEGQSLEVEMRNVR
ncbi:DEAD/DEAH box helicase [Candidatus Mycobacterium wuenschmannii]|uniref:DEAD/DEAH box helicase n=1 Tax=Candidatus Mycobacterium wuenschmannii TaxID=3027808 RepID=A0ABY8VWI4_9MYCO|nr:DEAD/DEAH box helicase [Candidatus Mycobacterium wuenschmannii]WIM87431.1 DEAD/DEAH box helicase [Candidatus Mycobacterium wuenschmannii]